MTSEEQIKANQENAQKSTGAINTDKTRFNATKHCLTSKKLFDLSYRDEIERNFAEHYELLKPENIIQEHMVRDLAVLRTKIDISSLKEAELFDMQKLPALPKSKEMLYDATNDFREVLDFGYDRLSDEQRKEYHRLKEEEKKAKNLNNVSFPNEEAELVARYQAEARNQYYKHLRAYFEMRNWLRFGK